VVEVVTRKPLAGGTGPATVEVAVADVVTHLKSLVQEDELLGGTGA